MNGGNSENEPTPPRWAIWVARAIAVVIVVPVRLAWESLRSAGRAVRGLVSRLVLRPLLAVVNWIGAAGGALARLLWRWLIAPVGRALRRALELVARALVRFALRPSGQGLRWLLGVTGRILRAVLVLVGRGLRAVLVPVGRGLRAVLVFVGLGLHRVFGAVGAVLGWALAVAARVLRAVLLDPLAWCWRVLVAVPLRWLWRNVIVRTARGVGEALWTVLRLCGTGLGWVVRRVGRVFAVLGWLVLDAFRWAGRRVALPLWRLLVWVFRVVLVKPARLVHRAVLAPVGRAIRQVVRVVVVTPARWVRTSVLGPVRLAGRRLRGQLRSAFGRRP